MLAMPCSQNRDLKCNRIYKLPVSSSCLGTFLRSLFFLFKLPNFTLSSIVYSEGDRHYLKCNRIYKLPVSSSCLGTFLRSLFFLFKLPIFTLSSIVYSEGDRHWTLRYQSIDGLKEMLSDILRIPG